MRFPTSRARTAVVAAAIGLASVAGGLSALPAGANDGQGPTPEAANCKQSFSSGAGANFLGWCYSDDGNLMRFESPATQEHLFVGTPLEGYALCAGGVTEGYNNGGAGAGFGVSSHPAANTVRRFSPRFRLDQVFSQNTAEKFVTITMKVTNVTGSPIANVQLSRFADFDMNGLFSSNRFEQVVASVTGAERHLLALTGRTFEVNKVSQIESFGDLADDTGCAATSPLAPPQTGDLSARVTYNLGTVNPGATKTVIFRYARM